MSICCSVLICVLYIFKIAFTTRSMYYFEEEHNEKVLFIEVTYLYKFSIINKNSTSNSLDVCLTLKY